MAPREKRQEAGRTAKKGEKNAAGRKKRKGTNKKVRVGVSCYYLICISQKTKNDVDEKAKGERTHKNTRPDIKRIFQTLSGANRQKIKQKHRQEPTKKHKTNTTTQKQKLAPQKFFQKATLRRERQKTTKDAEPDTKNTK